jgi:hypothetical protein
VDVVMCRPHLTLHISILSKAVIYTANNNRDYSVSGDAGTGRDVVDLESLIVSWCEAISAYR